ncbi:2-polyprenyl-6-methoxyphenol hydroxylase [Roseomonas rosea]|uniref:2-polyprenyl-6-methoxyphenol hydroxylase n=1 Tax=Muricoccus roseus TaxID=198092 RepID=A0A1M6L2G0_9PROT|nr:FAD-dependent monooxygenase [Roseomonas rosea]SHJ65336.1 2-polyprenyl-6-methoxyphenol hydroxylase [Roseomonas rosea]
MSVLIVGAGPVGLVLALSLRQRGIPYRLTDKAAERLPWSRALGIQARSLEMLDRLGLAQRILEEALPIHGACLHLGRRVVRARFRGMHPRFPSMVILPQARTEAILEAAGPPPERGVAFEGLREGRAVLRHADGREELAEAEWIVGCDGAHSAVRHALGDPFRGKRYDARLVLTDAHVEGLEPGFLHVAVSPPLLGFGLPGGLWRLVTTVPEGAPPPPENDMAPFRRRGIAPHDPVWWSAFGISQRQVASMRKGRVVLAGDAAHVHSPAGGQGMNIGMQDAWSLASALAAGPDAVEAAVEAWALQRHAVARRVLRATDRTTRAMLTAPGFLAPLRGALLALAFRTPPLVRRFEAETAGLRYPPIPD